MHCKKKRHASLKFFEVFARTRSARSVGERRQLKGERRVRDQRSSRVALARPFGDALLAARVW
jgi:hypothetical protein